MQLSPLGSFVHFPTRGGWLPLTVRVFQSILIVLLPYDTAMNDTMANCDRALRQTCKFNAPFIQAPRRVSHLG